MDLIFQVPMQYSSLQRRTSLPSPVTSTTGCSFCFGFISSFFLDLFLPSSPGAYWAPIDLVSSSFSVLSFCLFMLFMRFSWRRKWQPTPVFLPGESRGQRSLVGCCPWGLTVSDTTEVTQHACMHGRKKWQPTPVFLPGGSQGWWSLVGCHLWDRTESDTTKVT